LFPKPFRVKITEASKLPTATIEKPEEEEVYYVRSLPNTDASTKIEKPTNAKVSQGVSRNEFREILEFQTEQNKKVFQTINDRLDKLEKYIEEHESIDKELGEKEMELMDTMIDHILKKGKK